MRNTGKTTEQLFEASITALGKDGYYYRIKDAAAIKGLTGKVGLGIDATPSDYVCAVHGKTFFCEVKSTNHKSLFEFKLFSKGQLAHAARIIACGGSYLIVVRSLYLNDWFLLPVQFVFDHRERTGERSIKWVSLQKFRCSTVDNQLSW